MINWINTEVSLQCVKCDFRCSELVTMVAHQTTEHIKPKKSYKRKKKDKDNKLPLKGTYHGRFIP